MATRTTWAMILAGLAIFITLVVMLVRDGPPKPTPTFAPVMVVSPAATRKPTAKPATKPAATRKAGMLVPAHLLPRQWSDLQSKPIMPPSQRPRATAGGTPAPYIKQLYSAPAFKQTL